MSRIHEALKKAAQERAEHVPAAVESSVSLDPLELARPLAGVETIPAVETFPAAISSRSLSHDKKILRYEDLVKNCTRTRLRIDPRMSVFEGQDDQSLGAERFRTLRSRLYQIASAQTLRRLVITSTLPAEGKTFVAANLAQSIVRQPERRVLLIDGDLRATRLHLTLGMQKSPGLADYLLGEVDLCGAIQKEEGSNLCLISGGRDVSNPSELLSNPRLGELLDQVSPLFDWIILDAPPALPVHDASIIADLCDGVLFVVRAGVTDFEMASKAAEDFSKDKHLGVVLNRMERGIGYGGYYYSYPTGGDSGN